MKSKFERRKRNALLLLVRITLRPIEQKILALAYHCRGESNDVPTSQYVFVSICIILYVRKIKI